MSAKPSTIAFRVTPEERAELERLAASERSSAGDVARRLLRERLRAGKDSRDLGAMIESLSEEVTTLREGLAVTAQALLVNGGKPIPKEKVDAWVDKNLRAGLPLMKRAGGDA